MPPRGRGGNFRGRGGRGRGRGGRGGKATSRFGPNRRFDGTRLADNDESESSGSESESAPEDTDMEDIESEDDDDEHTTSSKPYMALLQSFNNESSAPDAKRRKLNHKNSTQSQPEEDPSGEESHADGQDEDTEKDIDRAEDEAEEEVEEKLDDEEDSEDEENPTDPFDVHFARPNDDTISQRVKSVQKNDWATKRALLQNMRATILHPGSDTGSEIPKPIAGLEGLQLKQKLRETSSRKIGDFDALQRNLGPLLFDYNDVLFCDRTVRNSDSLRELASLVANQGRTRDRVIKNNYKLAKEGQDADLELRDQGFTRPKVLFLLPTRNSALRMVNMIRDICEPDQQENRKRFDDGYVDKEAKFGADRPADFKDLFEGSDDDMFRLGMKFTRKTIKYFAQFYNSDILFASPLGLRMAIGSEEDKKLDFDFLSSIEMVIVDQADALLMQNWEHVEFIFEHMNLQPKDAHGCDFSRVRNWYLEDWAKYFRQTIILSAFNTPELSELLRLHCHNWAGKVRLQPEYPGMLSQLGIKAKQTFSRFQSSSVDKDPDARFEYFTSAIVPSLAKRAKDATGTLIFIPSYLDFVRVRNYFATSSAVENVTFGAISEYADVPEASRARSHFLSGRHRVLLYTERAHHFRRYQFRGVQRVIFYGLPDNPIFYTEIAGGYLSKSEQDLRLEPGQGTVKVVFSKYDVMKLERIVGSKRVGKMIQDRGDTFEFI
ncbi:u3 small nucleolar RNA-associated 25 [Fusarium subglutinans]|uniref:U3 small nucleolar RNA-associated protein 25 n=1 Tax=Gibberella subglutinans TaxID=42677 RepID=A0A8H5LES3_GIBSU|nr:u3 small nucleolar RNA-associated 25 [Fusarium subglutinans]KAF5590434.1 u3 small nucleolar RNA-associated 25 [Fusarium subglutinans]